MYEEIRSGDPRLTVAIMYRHLPHLPRKPRPGVPAGYPPIETPILEANTSVIGPGDTVELSYSDTRTDREGELATVECRTVSARGRESNRRARAARRAGPPGRRYRRGVR